MSWLCISRYGVPPPVSGIYEEVYSDVVGLKIYIYIYIRIYSYP